MSDDAAREDACREYQSSLEDLTFNSKPHINMLTILAEENLNFAKDIVAIIEAQIAKAPATEKLPVLYLVDSIVKNVGREYLGAFTKNLVTTFICVFEKVDENTRKSLFKLRSTWENIFPLKILYGLDRTVNAIDPAWPIRPLPPNVNSSSIHVNPKFLKPTEEIAPPRPSTPQITSNTSVVPEKNLTQEQIIRQQLLAKQKQLIELQQKKLELELEQTKAQLAANQLGSTIKTPVSGTSKPAPVGKVIHQTTVQVDKPCFPQQQDVKILTRDPRLNRTGQQPTQVKEQVPNKKDSHSSGSVLNTAERKANASSEKQSKQEKKSMKRESIVEEKPKSKSPSPLNKSLQGKSKSSDLENIKVPELNKRDPRLRKHLHDKTDVKEDEIKEKKRFIDKKERDDMSKASEHRFSNARKEFMQHTNAREERNTPKKNISDPRRPKRSLEERGSECRDSHSPRLPSELKENAKRWRSGWEENKYLPHGKPTPQRHKTQWTGSQRICAPRTPKPHRLSVDANLQIPEVLNSASKRDLLKKASKRHADGEITQEEFLVVAHQIKQLFQYQEEKQRSDSWDGTSEDGQFGPKKKPLLSTPPSQSNLSDAEITYFEHKAKLRRTQVQHQGGREPCDRLQTQRPSYEASEKEKGTVGTAVQRRFVGTAERIKLEDPAPQSCSRTDEPSKTDGTPINSGPTFKKSPDHSDQLVSFDVPSIKSPVSLDGPLSSDISHQLPRHEASPSQRFEVPSSGDLSLTLPEDEGTLNRELTPRLDVAPGQGRIAPQGQILCESPGQTPPHVSDGRFDGPQGPGRFEGRFDSPQIQQGPGRFDGPMRFDTPHVPQGPGRFDGMMRFGGPQQGPGRFDVPPSQQGSMRFEGPLRQQGPVRFEGPLRFEGQPMQPTITRFECPTGQPGPPRFCVPPNLQNQLGPQGQGLRVNEHSVLPFEGQGSQQPSNFNMSNLGFGEPLNVFSGTPQPFQGQQNMAQGSGFNGPPAAGPSGFPNSYCRPVTPFYNPSAPVSAVGNLNTSVPVGNLIPQQTNTVPFNQPAFYNNYFILLGSQFTTPESHFGQVDVNDLLTKLISTGIIKPAQTEAPPSEKTVPAQSQPVIEEEEEEEQDDDQDVPDLTGFVIEDMKQRYDSVINRLYTGIQCYSCGMRFTASQTDVNADHLDWHYRQNRSEKDISKKVTHRRWYYSLTDWIEFEEIADLEERAKSQFFEKVHEEVVQKTQEAAKEKEFQSVKAAPDVVHESCEICQEQFEMYWEEEEEEWHLKNAIRVDEKTYHPSCYEEYKNVSIFFFFFGTTNHMYIKSVLFNCNLFHYLMLCLIFNICHVFFFVAHFLLQRHLRLWNAVHLLVRHQWKIL
ncbi:PCF11 protein, partial [Amia calva]|nr:PCF11 protein [Amia calva]